MIKHSFKFILLIFSFGVLAKEPLPSLVSNEPVSFGNAYEISSKYLPKPPKFQVYLPDEYEEMAEHVRYPVIVTLDGWALSRTVSGVVAHLSNTASMPKAIVVAVDNHEDHEWGPELYLSKSGWNGKPEDRLRHFSGGKADDYLAFFEKELMPYIDANYRTEDFRILIGMSPSAAFALHSFWKAPELFDAHFLFAATDVIGMGYTPDTTFADTLAKSLSENPERKGFLYVASAQKEADEKPERNENARTLEKALAPYTNKNFKLKVEHISGFGHYPMALPGLINAIDLVFPRKDWDMHRKFNALLSAEGKAMDNILGKYTQLSEQVGFTVRPNVDLRRNAASLRVAGNRLMRAKRYQEAEELYRYWIKNSPESVKAWTGLASAMEEMGNLVSALSYNQKALDYAKTYNPSFVTFLRERISELERKVN